MSKLGWWLVALGFALVLSACNNPPPAPTVSSVVVSPPSPVACQVNGTVAFSAVAKDQNGGTISPQPAFAWASTLPSVAGVDAASGVASCRTVGVTNVTASAGGVTSEAVALTVADGVARFDSAKFDQSVFAP